MNASTSLRVRISADLSDIRQGLGLLRGELAKVQAQSARALPNGNAMVSGLRRARTELAAFAASYLSLRGAGLLAGIADEASLLRGRVKQARGDYEAILALANETRTGLAATVDLYARVERSTRGQIKNQGELLTLTKAVNQAAKLSFSNTSGQAIQQLGQALGSGTLSGDELKSIRENAIRLAEAIATGMGKSIGELKKLGAEGKLTTDVVIKALLSQADVLEREYAKIPLTIKDAFTQLRNSLVDYVGDQDAATGASKRFAETIKQIASDLPRYLDPVLQVITALLRNLDVLAVFMVTRMAGAAIPALIIGFTNLRKAIAAATTFTGGLRAALLLLGGPVGIVIAALAAGIYLVSKRSSEAKRAAEEHTRAMEANKNMAGQSRDAALADAKAKRQQALDTLKAAQAALVQAEIQAQISQGQSTSSNSKGGFALRGAANFNAGRVTDAQKRVAQAQRQFEEWGGRLVELALEINDEVLAGTENAAAATATATGEAKKAVKGVADAAELAGDAIQRQLKLLDQLLDDGKIKLSEFYAKKQQLQEQAIDSQIEQAKAEAATATTSEQQSKALTQIIKLQRDRAEIGPAVAREQAKAEAEVTEKLNDLRARLLEAQGDTLGARTIELRQEFDQLLEDLPADARIAGRAIIDQLFPIELAKAKLEELRQELQASNAKLGSKETSVGAQVGGGLMSHGEGDNQLDAARLQALQTQTALRDETLDYLETLDPSSPEAAAALSFLEEVNGSIGRIRESQQTLKQQFQDVATEALTQLFVDLATGAKSAGDALKDFVRNFIAGMAQVAAKALATFIVFRLFENFLPGFTAAFGAVSGTVKHAGGIVGSGGTIRSGLNPALFGAAPRYHAGGIAGLAPDEVPAILRRGEEVLTRDNPRHRSNTVAGAGAVGERITNIVVFSEDELANAMAGAAGEKVVVTHARSNRTAIAGG